ncbi:MAG: nitrilase-related carbon-nitrogen hydrolase [Thermodesulfobacteriota bacterium]
MSKTIKIAGIQFTPTTIKEVNLRRIASLIEVAAERDAKIVALPQLFNTPFFPSTIDKANFAFAEAEDGVTITAMRELSKKHSIVLICPIFEKAGENYFNTAFVLGIEGEIIGKYRKVHVPQIPLWEEASYFETGDLGFPVFDTPFGRIGVQLCWDTFFPEGFRILALNDAQIVFTPTASAFFHSHRKWERALSAAAHSNGLFIFRVNRTGAEGTQEFYGRSFCMRPDGEFVDEPSGSGEGVILTTLDLREISSVRKDWVFMKDRKPEHYSRITEDSA